MSVVRYRCRSRRSGPACVLPFNRHEQWGQPFGRRVCLYYKKKTFVCRGRRCGGGCINQFRAQRCIGMIVFQRCFEARAWCPAQTACVCMHTPQNQRVCTSPLDSSTTTYKNCPWGRACLPLHTPKSYCCTTCHQIILQHHSLHSLRAYSWLSSLIAYGDTHTVYCCIALVYCRTYRRVQRQGYIHTKWHFPAKIFLTAT